MSNTKIITKDPALLLAKTLDAPIALAWQAITQPTHLTQWWGPDGFTLSINEMNVIPGGRWSLVLHGPNGSDYQNEIIFREVILHKKLVLEYHTTPKHVTTIDFEAKGNQTLMTWHMTFESQEQLIQLVRDFQVDKDLEQNVEKWNQYLITLQTESNKS